MQSMIIGVCKEVNDTHEEYKIWKSYKMADIKIKVTASALLGE